MNEITTREAIRLEALSRAKERSGQDEFDTKQVEELAETFSVAAREQVFAIFEPKPTHVDEREISRSSS